MKNYGVTVFFFWIVLLTLWWGYSVYLGETSLLPNPVAVTKRLIFGADRFWLHSRATAMTMVFATSSALLFAIPCSFVMAKKPWTRPIVQSIFVVFQCLPMFALAPLMLLWFGWSRSAIVVPTALMIVFPLIITLYKGILATPQDYIDFFKAQGMREGQIWMSVRLPFALPFLFSGLKISLSVAGMGAIAGEWVGAQEGLGVFLQECRRNFDREGLFAALLCLLFLTLSLYALVHYLESRFIKRGHHEPC